MAKTRSRKQKFVKSVGSSKDPKEIERLEDGLSELIVENDIEAGSTIIAKLNEAKDKVIFEVIKNE